MGRGIIRGEHRDKDKPWYLWLCYGAITAPRRRRTGQGMHKNDEVTVPADIFPPREGKPGYLNRRRRGPRGRTGKFSGQK